MLDMKERSANGVRATIDALIHAGTTSDTDGLTAIYHKDMQVLMIDTDGVLARFDKPGFIDMLAETVANAERPPGTWKDLHVADAMGDLGHVLITRRVELGGTQRILFLSIDLLYEGDRWQVTREVILSRPDPEDKLPRTQDMEGT